MIERVAPARASSLTLPLMVAVPFKTVVGPSVIGLFRSAADAMGGRTSGTEEARRRTNEELTPMKMAAISGSRRSGEQMSLFEG